MTYLSNTFEMQEQSGAERLADIDHPVIEAIRGSDGGVSVMYLASLVYGYRTGKVILDDDSATVLAAAEICVGDPTQVSWGEYASVLAQVIEKQVRIEEL